VKAWNKEDRMNNERKPALDKENVYDDEPVQGCTGALVTGSTSAKGNMVGETVDFGLPFGENFKVARNQSGCLAYF
jgi:hypothetical protein